MIHHIDDSWDADQSQWKPLHWQVQPPILEYSHPFLQLHSMQCSHPISAKVLQSCCVHSMDWVNIFGITPSKQLIVVMQFRFGTQQLSLETPGGIVDPGEDHQEAAIREFQEETGFFSSQIHYVGSLTPNAATHANQIHYYCFKNCVEQESSARAHDELECIEVALISLSNFESLIRKGQLDHALIIAGYYLSLPYLLAE